MNESTKEKRNTYSLYSSVWHLSPPIPLERKCSSQTDIQYRGDSSSVQTTLEMEPNQFLKINFKSKYPNFISCETTCHEERVITGSENRQNQERLPIKLTIHAHNDIDIETQPLEECKLCVKDFASKISDNRNTHAYVKQYLMELLTPSDNKLSLKLFGSKKAVLKEKIRHEKEGKFIIHPCSNFRFYWDVIMLILLMANVLILPLAITFFHQTGQNMEWTAFNLISDTLFLLDILINFRTGVIANNYVDEIVLDPKLIARSYIKGWFFIDIISSFPVDYIFLLLQKNSSYQFARTGRAIKAIRLFRLLSLLRLLRVSRLVRYANQWEEFLSIAAVVMRVLNLVGLIMLIAHWNGCLQFLVPLLQDFPPDCWVSMNHLQNETWTKQYTLALFKALSHMLSIGYGRYPPKSYSDMWLTMLSMIIGAIVYATTIGHVSVLVHSFDTSRRFYNEKMRQVEEYMLWRKLPRYLRNRVTDYYEHRYQGKMFDEKTILGELSETLRSDIINHNCRALVSSVPFFANADSNFVNDIITKLEFEMFQPGDLIIAEGTIGNKMYFIQDGIVDIIKPNGEVLTTLSDGSYFGEICLLTKAKRTASVKAVSYCYLYSLSAEHFDMVLSNFPTVRRTIEIIAHERLNKLTDQVDINKNSQWLFGDNQLLKDIFSKDESEDTRLCDSADGTGAPQQKRNKKRKRCFMRRPKNQSTLSSSVETKGNRVLN